MNNMIVALQITALGMGLVFAALLLLWWMMNLLTSLTADKEAASESSPETPPAIFLGDERKAQAAAVAVAIALAEAQASTAHPWTEPPPALVSAWQLGMRTRQMYQKGSSIRRRARQDGK